MTDYRDRVGKKNRRQTGASFASMSDAEILNKLANEGDSSTDTSGGSQQQSNTVVGLNDATQTIYIDGPRSGIGDAVFGIVRQKVQRMKSEGITPQQIRILAPSGGTDVSITAGRTPVRETQGYTNSDYEKFQSILRESGSGGGGGGGIQVTQADSFSGVTPPENTIVIQRKDYRADSDVTAVLNIQTPGTPPSQGGNPGQSGVVLELVGPDGNVSRYYNASTGGNVILRTALESVKSGTYTAHIYGPSSELLRKEGDTSGMKPNYTFTKKISPRPGSLSEAGHPDNSRRESGTGDGTSDGGAGDNDSGPTRRSFSATIQGVNAVARGPNRNFSIDYLVTNTGRKPISVRVSARSVTEVEEVGTRGTTFNNPGREGAIVLKQGEVNAPTTIDVKFKEKHLNKTITKTVQIPSDYGYSKSKTKVTASTSTSEPDKENMSKNSKSDTSNKEKNDKSNVVGRGIDTGKNELKIVSVGGGGSPKKRSQLNRRVRKRERSQEGGLSIGSLSLGIPMVLGGVALGGVAIYKATQDNNG